MGILKKTEMEQLEELLALLRTPVPATEQADQAAQLERLSLYLLELANDRGFVL